MKAAEKKRIAIKKTAAAIREKAEMANLDFEHLIGMYVSKGRLYMKFWKGTEIAEFSKPLIQGE